MDFYTCYSTPAHLQPPEHPTSGISLVTSQFLYKPKRYPRLLGMWLLPIAQNTKCRPGFGEDGKKWESTWVEKRQRSSVMYKIFFGGGVFWLVFFSNRHSKLLWRICRETITVFRWWHLCCAQPNSQRWQSQPRHLQPWQPNLPAHTPPEIALGGLRNPTGFQPISSCLESVINCNCLFDFISIFSGSGQFGKALRVPTGENAHQCMHLLVWSYQLPSGSAFLRASLENETEGRSPPFGKFSFLSCIVTDKKISVPAGDMSSNQGSVQAQLGSTRFDLPASHKVFWQIALTGILKKRCWPGPCSKKEIFLPSPHKFYSFPKK